MRAKLANINHCAVPFLSSTAANLCTLATLLRNTESTRKYDGKNDFANRRSSFP